MQAQLKKYLSTFGKRCKTRKTLQMRMILILSICSWRKYVIWSWRCCLIESAQANFLNFVRDFESNPLSQTSSYKFQSTMFGNVVRNWWAWYRINVAFGWMKTRNKRIDAQIRKFFEWKRLMKAIEVCVWAMEHRKATGKLANLEQCLDEIWGFFDIFSRNKSTVKRNLKELEAFAETYIARIQTTTFAKNNSSSSFFKNTSRLLFWRKLSEWRMNLFNSTKICLKKEYTLERKRFQNGLKFLSKKLTSCCILRREMISSRNWNYPRILRHHNKFLIPLNF